MSLLRPLAALCVAALAATSVVAQDSATAPKPGQSRKVLVVLSNAHQLDLRDGEEYNTGYYLDELAVPLQKLVAAGYSPVFASPQGKAASFDPVSNDKMFFGGDDTARANAVKFVGDFPGIQHPQTLAQIEKQGTSDYAGVFIPGGHAPMQDLSHDKTLGAILMDFHVTGRPTGVICHGPAALLSTLPDPEAFRNAMIAGDFLKAASLARGWPYANYRLTVFASGEEHAIEGKGRQLGGYVKFYAADALSEAGAHVDRVGAFQPNVIEDRELVSGQQPFSSDAFGDAFVAKLKHARL
ncbi:type 1 glutamine amidotransferase domain-containing protein [Paraburkholderia humisilvae]|uniref:type 1 glutamine amidotransferase domain-containing protein n=1 Tax=Paraburkholderia humisilvae TaxID=627669 RepID=UPI00158249C7|nr:type 1 glutamine amidotransferase domain-containing protein [Paraburkholderia humisilvae]